MSEEMKRLLDFLDTIEKLIKRRKKDYYSEIDRYIGVSIEMFRKLDISEQYQTISRVYDIVNQYKTKYNAKYIR